MSETSIESFHTSSGDSAPTTASRSPVFQNNPPAAAANVPPCSQMYQDIPQRSTPPPPPQNYQTNPISSPEPSGLSTQHSPLTPRQLAAARGLIQGLSTTTVAAQLKTTRQTINRWRRSPAFAAELQRLHLHLLQPPSHPSNLQPSNLQPSKPQYKTSPTDPRSFVQNLLRRHGFRPRAAPRSEALPTSSPPP